MGRYLPQNNVSAIVNILTRRLVILGFNEFTVYFKHNIGGEECNCKFKNLTFDIWCVIEFKHLSMHLNIIFILYQLWP
jgi:hypothetical protein